VGLKTKDSLWISPTSIHGVPTLQKEQITS